MVVINKIPLLFSKKWYVAGKKRLKLKIESILKTLYLKESGKLHFNIF